MSARGRSITTLPGTANERSGGARLVLEQIDKARETAVLADAAPEPGAGWML